MKTLRSSHRKFLTVFLFVYFGVLFISFTNLNMKESLDTDVAQTLSSKDMNNKELLYSPFNPSDNQKPPLDLSLSKKSPIEASQHKNINRLLYQKSFVNYEKVPVSPKESQQPHPMLQPLQQHQNQQQEPPAKTYLNGSQRYSIYKTNSNSSTQASFERAKDRPSKNYQSLDDTEQAKAWLFEMEKDFPGLKNFQPDPLVEPFGDINFGNTRNDGDFIPLGREAYVYSAYLDERRRSDLGVFVRVIVLLSQKSATASIYSHREGKDTSSSERCLPYEMCENHSKFYGGYIFSCLVQYTHSKDRPTSSSNLLPAWTNKDNVSTHSVNISSVLLSLGKYAPQIKIPVRTVNPNPSKISYLDSYPSKTLLFHNWQQDINMSKNAARIQTGLFVPPSESQNFTNKTRLEKQKSNSLSFAVCISPLFGNISPKKVVEFIELTHLLGADHFYVYNFSIPASISRILEHYKSLGLVTVLQLKFPVGVRSTQLWYHGQLLTNNDCLYRTMPHHDLVAFNDLDEFIVPHLGGGGKTWNEAFSSLLTSNKSGFSFQSAFYDNGFPTASLEDGQKRDSTNKNLITMTSTARTKRFSKIRTKVMLCPWRVFEVGIHHISKQNREEWLPLSVDPSLAMLHHYRSCVANLGMRCDSWTADTTIPDHYGHNLVRKVRKTMGEIFRSPG